MQNTLSLTSQAGLAPLLRPLQAGWRTLVQVSAVHTRIAYACPWQGRGTGPAYSAR